jgi:spermidine synthase
MQVCKALLHSYPLVEKITLVEIDKEIFKLRKEYFKDVSEVEEAQENGRL